MYALGGANAGEIPPHRVNFAKQSYAQSGMRPWEEAEASARNERMQGLIIPIEVQRSVSPVRCQSQSQPLWSGETG